MMMNLIKDCITFFQAGGVFMYPLAACSVLLIAAVIYRMFNMKKSLICPVVLTRAVERTELERIAADSDSVEGRLVLDALNSPLEDEASLKEMIQVKAREEFVTLQAGLPLLDMIVMIAPMFGILGTASGLVQIFSVFGMDESHGMIAQGIAQALNTTIAGLAIATPAVIAHVYYSRKLPSAAIIPNADKAMQFYRKKARSMGVPIVPMIDILTILLIFFIVHTQWKKPQSLLKIDVPGAEFMEGTPSSEQRAVLAVTGTSAISLNGRLVEMNELAAALEALKKENPGVKLQLDVDKKAEFGVIVGIWDALTSVGIDAGEVPARIEINKPGAR